MSNPTTATSAHRCVECEELARGRERAQADRDLSKVTDFNVLIARHRLTHQGNREGT
jgi:hypothetical protein